MQPYDVFLRKEVTESLRGVKGEKRERIAAFIDSLVVDPFQSGDYSEPDASARDAAS